MKLTAILLLAAALQVSAKGFGQVITLNLKNASLEKAISEIEKQSGFSFVYGKEQLAQAKAIDLTVSNEKLERVLELIFKDQPLSFTISGKYIALKQKATVVPPFGTVNDQSGPPIDIRGRVVNENGQPVEGAIVSIKGTNKRVATNANGEFILTGIEINSILVISAVNIETYEVKVTDKANILVNVKSKITTVAEVSVEANTGYQKIKPNETNGSYVVIDNKILNEQVGPSILDRLKNVGSSVFFDTKRPISNQSNLNINIRGFSTIHGSFDPLIVLDNFIYEGDLNNINPNDVESITILKDAVAASIWGARAANGVIVITSKRGRFNQKLKIEFNTNITIVKSPDLFKIPQLSTDDFIDVEEYLFNKGFNLADTASISKPSLTPVYEILLKRRYGIISSADSAKQIDALRSFDARNEYNKYFYHDAITQQYSLNLRGGSGNIAWLIAGGYNRSIGALKSRFDKGNIRLENIYKPFKQVEIIAGISYTNSKSINSSEPAFNSITVGGKSLPYLHFVDDNGNQIPIDSRYRGTFTDNTYGGRLLNWKYYPLEDYKHNKNSIGLQQLSFNTGVKFNVTKGLSINVNYQYQKQWAINERESDMESFYARDLINKYTQLGTTIATDTFRIPRGSILEISNSNLQSYNFRSQINYEKNWKNHAFSAILGFEFREVNSSGSLSTIYGYIKDPLSTGLVNFYTPYKTFVTGFSEYIPGIASLSPTIINRFVSAYANVGYSYKQKYTFSVSGRKDASNIFGQSTNDRWNPLWSAGLGWELSKESFYPVKRIPFLRIKASFGLGGNLDLNKTPLPVAGSFTNPATNYPFLRINNLNNPSLRWEKSKQLNIGIDFATKNKTFSGSIEYYIKKGTDLYGDAPYDYTAWGLQRSLTRNVANMQGKGIDIVLNTLNTKGAFKWTTTVIFNYNTSKTTAYYTENAGKVSSFIGTSGRIVVPVVGKPLYALVALKWGGLNASGDPQGYVNGQLSTDYQSIFNEASAKGLDGNLLYIGRADPPYYGSVINRLTWKGFSFSINMSYKYGHFFLKDAVQYNSLFSNGTGYAEFSKRWKSPGDELLTNVPAMVYANYPQFTNRDAFYKSAEINIQKGDNIRIEYINLGYLFQNKSAKKSFQSIQFNLNMANLGIIWRANSEKLDPDYGSFISPTRQLTFGANIIF